MNEEICSLIESRISTWLSSEEQHAPVDESKQLIRRIHELILRGGKRMRPQLLVATYIAYGGNKSEQLIDLGVALEFHHQFLLAHDDIIDNDTVRYDGPNIVGYYKQEFLDQKQNIAQAMGLIAGDLLFSFANKVILQDRYTNNKQKVLLLEILNDVNIDVGYGQQLDSYNVDATLNTFTADRLMLIHSLKSARYSTQLPMQCAAILLNLKSAERKKIDKFAIPFGILFQLVDDYSDYFVNSSAFNNRPKYRDFCQGKITYPLYHALGSSNSKDTTFLRKHLGSKDLSKDLMCKVITILEESGAKEASRDYVNSYFAKANIALNKLTLTPASRQQFTKMLDNYKV